MPKSHQRHREAEPVASVKSVHHAISRCRMNVGPMRQQSLELRGKRNENMSAILTQVNHSPSEREYSKWTRC